MIVVSRRGSDPRREVPCQTIEEGRTGEGESRGEDLEASEETGRISRLADPIVEQERTRGETAEEAAE